MAFIDLHSHILPGLDDGAPNPKTGLEMVRALSGVGFTTICATPHQKDGQFLPALDRIRTAHADLRATVRAEGLPVNIPLAAENMWDNVFYARCQDGSMPSYDDGPAFLFELPLQPKLPMGLFDELFRLRRAGRLPVLAHPERYEALWKNDDLVARLASQCAMVIDLGALVGYHGRRRAKLARKLVKAGTAHAAASDSHTPEDVLGAAEGIAWLAKKLGAATVDRLLTVNPQAILTGQHPES